MLSKSPAIVLRSVDFRETSRIITLFTRELGKIAVIVKGFRSRKSKYAGIMNYGAVLDSVFYYKNNRSVQTLKDADVRISTVKIQSDFNKLALSMALLELCDLSTHEHEPHAEMFDFMESFLNWLNDTPDESGNLFPYLQLRVAELSGVALQLKADTADEALYLNIISGNLSSTADDGLSFRLKPTQRDYLFTAMQGRTMRLINKDIPVQELKTLINHLDVYLKHHIEGLRDRKSDAIFEEILK